MKRDPAGEALAGLERSCERPGRDRIVAGTSAPGIERIEAHFAGKAFAPHRHDTYAIGVTLSGVQTFRYRGEQRYSRPGQVLVLHPDELHDGGAATAAGLRYRMLYLEPSLLRACLDGSALPFVPSPVLGDAPLRDALLDLLDGLDTQPEHLRVDDCLARIAHGLGRHAEQRPASGAVAVRQAALARDYLETHATRCVGSAELERVSGLDRYQLSRHFRTLYATSPHRFHVMRRLQRARALMMAGEPLAAAAAASGFADQAHFTRHFKKAYGMAPGRWRSLATPAGCLAT